MGIPLNELDEDTLEELRLELYCPDRAMAFAPWRRELEALEAKAARYGIVLRPQVVARAISSDTQPKKAWA